MDLNHLYHLQQVCLFFADTAESEQARRVHRDLADDFAVQIAGAKNPARPVRAA